MKAAYESADGVIVLSQCHAREITKNDGYDGPFAFAQNGIDPAGFPPLVARHVPTPAEIVADVDWSFMLVLATMGKIAPTDVVGVAAASWGAPGGKPWRILVHVTPGVLPNQAEYAYVYAVQPAAGWGGTGEHDGFIASLNPEKGWLGCVPPAEEARLDLGAQIMSEDGAVRFEEIEEGRDPHRCIYASSPDRGLEHLLNIWPRVRKEIPDATLDIFYDWKMFEQRLPIWHDRLYAKVMSLAGDGVVLHGGVDHDTLHAAYRKSSVWSYPTGFTEISCVSAMKALASGCRPVTTDVGALLETLAGSPAVIVTGPDWGDDVNLFVEADEWADETDPGLGVRKVFPARWKEFEERYLIALVENLRAPMPLVARQKMREAAIKRFDWAVAATMFRDILFLSDKVGL